MDKIINIFRNKWVKLGFSVLSFGYAAFLGYVAWLSYAYNLKPTNGVPLFILYLFINVIFGVLMIYTRDQIPTQVVACVLHPILIVTLMFAFGNWFLLIPPFVVATVVFFASRAGESLKTVLGTIYLIFIVLGILGYLTLQIFTIDIFNAVDLNLRCEESQYEYSPNGTYRLVMYIDDESKEQRTVSYYIEEASLDMNLPFLKCERIYGCVNILNTRYEKQPVVEWMSDNQLLIDGKLKTITMNGDEPAETDDEELSGETVILTTSVSMTKATTNAPEEIVVG